MNVEQINEVGHWYCKCVTPAHAVTIHHVSGDCWPPSNQPELDQQLEGLEGSKNEGQGNKDEKSLATLYELNYNN